MTAALHCRSGRDQRRKRTTHHSVQTNHHQNQNSSTTHIRHPSPSPSPTRSSVFEQHNSMACSIPPFSSLVSTGMDTETTSLVEPRHFSKHHTKLMTHVSSTQQPQQKQRQKSIYIPLDVVSNILEFLKDDPLTLSSTSLVSRAWHDLSNAALWESPRDISLKSLMLCLANSRQQRLLRIASTVFPSASLPSPPHVTPPSRFSQGTTAAIHLPWPSRYIRHITFPTHPDPFLVSSSFGISLLAVRLSPTPSTNLRSITIPNADAIPHRFILMLLSASPNLKSLSLGGMEVDDALLGSVPGFCRDLRHVRLTGTSVTAKGFVKFAARFEKGLERIDLDRVDDAEGWQSALPIIPTCRWDRLKSLSVHFCGIKAKLVLAILASGGGPNLETINVGNLTSLHHPLSTPSLTSPLPELTPSAVDLIQHTCPHLRDVCFNDVDEAMTVRVAVNCGKRLRSLKLCQVGGGVTDQGIDAVAEACPNLQVFRIVFGGPRMDVDVSPLWDMDLDDHYTPLTPLPPPFLDDIPTPYSVPSPPPDYPIFTPLTPTSSPSVPPSPTLPAITPPSPSPSHTKPSSSTLTDRSLIHLLTVSTHLIEFGCIGASAPITPPLLTSLLTSPSSQTLRRINLASTRLNPQHLLYSVMNAASLGSFVWPNLLFLEIPWLYGGTPLQIHEIATVVSVVRDLKMLDIRDSLDSKNGRMERMVNGRGGEVDVMMGGDEEM